MNLPFLKKPSQLTIEPSASAQFAAGITTIQDILAPDAIEVDFSHLKIGSKLIRTLFVAGYPRFVTANWLSPLINFDHSLDVSMFIYPVEGKGVLDDLRRKITEMEAEINSDIQRGRIPNIDTQIKLEDAKALQEQLAKGAERFYQFGLYITITADNFEELDHLTKQIQSTLGALLIIAKPATLQMEPGFKTTQPLGQDYLNITRNMDTTSLATTFPFTSSELTANEGIMYGINEHNDSLVIFDRFTMENANTVILSKSGGGKSAHTSTKFIVRQNGKISIEKIGPFVNKLMARSKVVKIDAEIEGVVNPNIEVLTFDQTLNVSWSPVTVAARKDFNKRRKLYRVTTQSGREIIITADHNLVTLRNGKIRTMRAEAVKIGERLPLSRILPEPETPHQTISLAPGQLVKNWPKTLPQKINLTPDFIYLLGLITSEGHIRADHLQISNSDLIIQKNIKSVIAALGLRSVEVYKKDGIVRTIIVRPGCFGSFIQAIGGGGRAGNKRIPPLIFSLSNQKAGAYLRGYFDGDGCVEQRAITAISKSKNLISDLAYLLLRFGIIARLSPKFKRATNAAKHRGETYWQLNISGKNQIEKFTQSIGFSHPEKINKLQKLISKLKTTTENTNVDTVPEVAPLFKKLYRQLFSGTKTKTDETFTAIKNGVYNPSPNEILKHVAACRRRIVEIKNQRDQIHRLAYLPSLEQIIKKGSRKPYNSLLWQEFGESWRLMKNKLVQPYASTVLRAYKTIAGDTVTVEELVSWTQENYHAAGESLWKYNRNLSPGQKTDSQNTPYEFVWKAGQNIISFPSIKNPPCRPYSRPTGNSG